jgi:hypothetical protein
MMKRLGIAGISLVFLLAMSSLVAASPRLMLFEYFSNTG